VLVDTLFGLSAGRRVDVHAVWMAELGSFSTGAVYDISGGRATY
jgi:hypothetical protein